MNPMGHFNVMFFMMLMIYFLGFLKKSNNIIIFFMMKLFDFSESKSLLMNNKKIIMNIIFFMFFINFMSLFSHIYGQFSMISINMSLSFTFWLTMFLKEFIYKFSFMMQFLTPASTPLFLLFAMSWTELVSLCITSMTLMVRLSANMMTGHLILSQISGLSLTSLMGQMFLLQFEFMVSLVQSYVFTKLVILYINK